MLDTFRSSILAGIAISVGGFVNLAVGGGIAGAVFFAFGLVTVVSYRMKLYTGYVGFMDEKGVGESLLILLGNVVGCILVGWLAKASPMDLQAAGQKILEARLATGALKCGALAIGCGFAVTTSVTFARQDKWLPLVLGVPVFILCGFPHCIADAFYYLAAPSSFLFSHFWAVMALWACIIFGNFIGCNLFRLIMWKKN